MRVVIQRVAKATLSIDGNKKSEIGIGLLILLGIEEEDVQEDIFWLTSKIAKLRIFPDKNQVMNLSVQEIKGEVMVVSQFTLHASTKKGNRPSYIRAAKPKTAIAIYELFVSHLQKEIPNPIQTGEFGAMMDIELTNTGPVTIIIDSKNKE